MSNNGTAKKVLGFLFMSSAMTTRNLSSVGLVALFFGVYVAAGGTVSVVPTSIAPGSSFGTVSNQQTNKESAANTERATAVRDQDSQAQSAPAGAERNLSQPVSQPQSARKGLFDRSAKQTVVSPRRAEVAVGSAKQGTSSYAAKLRENSQRSESQAAAQAKPRGEEDFSDIASKLKRLSERQSNKK